MDDELRFQTLAVHGGERRPGPEGSLVFPIYQGTVYAVEPGTDYHDLRYLRLSSTPSQRYLHDKLAALEGAEAALATASGMAAVTSILLTVLRAGDHVLASDCLYGGTHDFLTEHAEQLGWTYTLVDAGEPDSWERARTPQTKVFLVETITNPMMRVRRLREVAEFGRRHGLTTIIDNTFASPVNFRPLAAGFDLCLPQRDEVPERALRHRRRLRCVGQAELVDRVRRTVNHLGGSLDPHAGFLLARGLKTLALRVAAQNANATTLARFLAEQPGVAEVNYPGLETHPDHPHAAELLSGFGGMLSFRPAGGTDAAAALLGRAAAPVRRTEPGRRRDARHPAGHHLTRRDERGGPASASGITDDLIRVSCGIEARRGSRRRLRRGPRQDCRLTGS